MILISLLFFSDWTFYDTEVFRLLSPDEVVVTGQGIFISNQETCQITFLGLDGKKIKTFGGKGQGPGEMQVPLSLFANEKGLYVVDPQMGGVHVFDLKGNFEKRIVFPSREADYFLAKDGWLFGDWIFARDPKKPIELTHSDLTFENSKVIHQWPRGDVQAGMMIIEDGSGRPAKMPYNPARERVSAASSPDGQWLYVSGSKGFEVMRIDMAKITVVDPITKELAAVPYNEEWGLEQYENLKERNKRMAEMFEPKFPETFPYIRGMRVLPSGELAVELWSGRPDLDRNYLLFENGQEVSRKLGQPEYQRWLGLVGDQAIVMVWDQEDEVVGLASVKHAEMHDYMEKNPVVYDGPPRQISISIEN